MKIKNYLLIFLVITLYSIINAQPYNGPATGSVASGVMVSTGLSFTNYPKIPDYLRPPRNKFVPAPIPDPANLTKPNQIKTKYIEDPILLNQKNILDNDTLLKSFIGITDIGQFIPPDPYLAANEYYLIATVNSSFRILNRDGANMFSRASDLWFNSLIPNAGSFDPKVIYDHYAKRWVMVWLHAQSGSVTNANYLVSVSDDSIPAGTWYNWKLSSTVNGTNASSNWGDYQGVGYDENNIYITSNQFNASGSFDYPRIRIIPKSNLYANNAGTVNWVDIWNIYEPNGNAIFGLRPVRMETPSDKYYFVASSRYNTGTFFTVCELSNPTSTNPTMTVTNVPVGVYYPAPNSKQLNSTYAIDGGGSNLRNEPIYKDGKIYLTHSIASGTGNASSSVRYLKIDAANKTVDEDMALGMDNYFHFYPAIGVDKMGNVVLTYSRSATTEYAGAFYTIKEATSSTLAGSKLLKAGAGTYYKTYGGTRNRWGDYNSAWVDPTDHNSVWLFTEYVYSTNYWGSWIGQVKILGGGTACKDVNVSNGWNILSVPVTATNMSPTGLYPNKTSNAYGYENNYVVADTLKTGKGYWIKFGLDQTVQVCGVTTTSTTIPVNQGWNLIGGYDRSAPTSGITSSPSGIISSVFYGYNNNYSVADSLKPGYGYWIKTSQSGTLNLAYSSLAKSNIDYYQNKLNELPYLTVIDNSGNSSKVYLTLDKNIDLSYYELPPAAPEMISDVRFSSNRFVENLLDRPTLKIQSSLYPLTIVNNSGRMLLIKDNINGKLINKNLKENEKLILEKSSINSLQISSDLVPKEFGLSQNYPNPFNPKTIINYQIPENSFVSLKIYDVLGKEISTLVNEQKSAGNYSIEFDGTKYSSGIYIYKLISGNKEFSKKMILNK